MLIPRFLLLPIARILRRPILRHIHALDLATANPRATQEQLLLRILRRHADTDFARKHGFASIHSPADFQRQLPVAGYDYFEPYIARVRKGEFRALLGDDVVHMFALTSGTTASRKFIPVTQQYLDDYRRGWHIWGIRSFRAHPNIRMRPILQISSDYDEFRTEANIPCGSVTGLTARMQKLVIRWLYCAPACVAGIKDPLAKNYTVMRLSIPRKVGMIIAANPSTLLNLARLGDQQKEALIRDIHDGTLDPRFDVPPPIRHALRRRLRPNRRRARELEAIAARTGTLYPRDYWSSDHLMLGNWTGGSMGAYLRHYPQYFGNTPVRDVGLIASEGRMTIPFEDHTPAGILDITTHYFEFIPESEIDSPNPTVLAAHELQEGGKYFILPTTAFGLYRYNIHDLVRVAGFYNQTPLIEFLNKGSLISNITGEKLSEYHVTSSMKSVLQQLNLSIGTYSVAPVWNDEMPFYALFLEDGELSDPAAADRLAVELDQTLAHANIEYANKRETLRLGALRIHWLPKGTWAWWDRQRLSRAGGTPEQYKHPCLISDLHFRDSLRRPDDQPLTSSPTH